MITNCEFRNNTHTLTLDAETMKESIDFYTFSKVGDTFAGELRRDPHYERLRIILRKETT